MSELFDDVHTEEILKSTDPKTTQIAIESYGSYGKLFVYDLLKKGYDIREVNPPTFGHTYPALIFSLTKRHSNNWQFYASLTWSKAEGLDVNAHSGSSWALMSRSDLGKDPNDLINSKDVLNHDRTWIGKLQASYSFPWGILASMNYLYQTGKPMRTFVRIYPDQGRREILAEQRGTERNKPWSLFDFRLQKTFNIHKSLRLDAMLDVFNLFNSATVTGNRSNDLWSRTYREPSSIFYPRRLQIGLRLKF